MQILPTKTASGPQNMAEDSLLLSAFPHPNPIRFRHYQWNSPTLTFGYFQHHKAVNTLYPNNTDPLIRRPTGGGIVDHHNDWTYSLVIPPPHDLFSQKACLTYKLIHQTIASTLSQLGVPADIQLCQRNSAEKSPASACFTQPEVFDVIEKNSSRKLAGAAMKRNSNGLLVQGSISKDNLSLNWDQFHQSVIENLAKAFNSKPETITFPEFPEKDDLIKQFSSKEWNEKR